MRGSDSGSPDMDEDDGPLMGNGRRQYNGGGGGVQGKAQKRTARPAGAEQAGAAAIQVRFPRPLPWLSLVTLSALAKSVLWQCSAVYVHMSVCVLLKLKGICNSVISSAHAHAQHMRSSRQELDPQHVFPDVNV